MVGTPGLQATKAYLRGIRAVHGRVGPCEVAAKLDAMTLVFHMVNNGNSDNNWHTNSKFRTMQTLNLKRFLLTLLLGAFSGQAVAGAPYVFAPLPMGQPEAVLRKFKPMLAYLERETGLTFGIAYTRDYGELLRLFREGKVDMAYLGPLPYVQLRQQFNAALPLVHFLEPTGDPRYTCALVELANDGAIRGKPTKRVALTQPLSTCGFLATDGLLSGQGEDLGQMGYRYLGTHDQVALSVIRGDFDLGGMKTDIARGYGHLGLRVVGESEGMPAFSLIANRQKMSAAHAEAVRQALLRLRPGSRPGDAREVSRWGGNIRHGAVPAADSDFGVVRRMLRGKKIPETGSL